MKVFRALYCLLTVPVCCVIIALFSGCATATKPSLRSTEQPPATPPPLPVETKTAQAPVPTSPVQSSTTPAPAVIPAPASTSVTPAITPPPTVVVRHATILGSQESSILLDNYTAFVATVDGKKIEAGRRGWNIPLEIETGRRVLEVEFNRGVFFAKGRLEFDAAVDARYELKYATDAELFGHNSYCNFWVVDTRNGQTVSMVSKASVQKVAEAPKQGLLP
jgi:hypothetical protein